MGPREHVVFLTYITSITTPISPRTDLSNDIRVQEGWTKIDIHSHPIDRLPGQLIPCVFEGRHVAAGIHDILSYGARSFHRE